MSIGVVGFVVLLLGLLSSAIKILREYERAVVFRLGRVLGSVKGPGVVFLIPLLDKMERIDLRVVTMDVPSQDVITRDNISVKVNAVVYFRVLHPLKAVIEVEDYLYATSQLAQTTLRSICGEVELDQLLADREKINTRVQDILDRQSEPWGIKVSMVELKHIDLPQEMQRAMARQAEAERERRAKIISAEGEYQAAEKLSQASQIMAQNPMSFQLRYLQTLVEIAGEGNTTTLFPIPMELLNLFQKPKA